jgi:hypothetical protein
VSRLEASPSLKRLDALGMYQMQEIRNYSIYYQMYVIIVPYIKLKVNIYFSTDCTGEGTTHFR